MGYVRTYVSQQDPADRDTPWMIYYALALQLQQHAQFLYNQEMLHIKKSANKKHGKEQKLLAFEDIEMTFLCSGVSQ